MFSNLSKCVMAAYTRNHFSLLINNFLKMKLPVGILIFLFVTQIYAEDIDIYMTGEFQKPQVNILVIMDNSANWSSTADWAATPLCNNKDTKFCYLKEALQAALADVDIEGLTIGVLVFADGLDGAFPRYAARPMGLTSTVNSAHLNNEHLRTFIGSLNINNDKTNNSAFALALYEAYLYFQGMPPYHTPPTPPLKWDTGTITLGDLSTIEKGDGGAIAGSNYKELAAIGACNISNVVMFLSNGPAGGNEDGTAQVKLTAVGGNTSQIDFDLSGRIDGSEPNWADEFARFLYSSTGIRIFTIDVAPSTKLQDVNNSELLKSMARQSNGTYFNASSADSLTKSLKEVFNQIQIANSVFATPALPMSATSRNVSLNQVYLGMFRPDKNPRWFGNLKLYQFALTNLDPNDTSDNPEKTLVLVDSTGSVKVEDTSSGIIAKGARSFWTHTTDPSFWNFRCMGPNGALEFADKDLCGDPVTGSDAPDGAVVEKGAAGQMLREASTRNVYTCIGCTTQTNLGDTGTLFTTGNAAITQSALNASSTEERNAIINWVRGVDNISENTSVSNGARPSIPGDILHSQPLAINYNSSASNCADTAKLDKDIIVYYAGNDGLLHATKGGKNDITGAGTELWSFVPEEFFGYFKRVRDNAPALLFPAPVPAGVNNKPYMIDGSLTAYAPDDNGDCKPDKVWLFVTLRRGGRTLYAFDVSNPASPKFKWKITNTGSFAELGQTWSAAMPIKLADKSIGLVFGAGYDPNFEDRPFNTTTKVYTNQSPLPSKTMGRGVFVVKADTGALLRHFGSADGLIDAVPSDVQVVKDSLSGIAKLAYVGDTGGNLWRLSFLGPNGAVSDSPSDWSATKIATLGDPNDPEKDGTYARKFLYPPDVVNAAVNGAKGYALMIGSGDREKPFDILVANRFYMVKDAGTGPSPAVSCQGNESNCNLRDVTSLGTAVDAVDKGWLIKLLAGEKSTGRATTTAGVTFFNTNQPDSDFADPCKVNLGISRLYAVDYKSGGVASLPGLEDRFEDRSVEIKSGGFPPSPTIVTVEIDGKAHSSLLTIGADASKQAGEIDLPMPNTQPGLHYWYQENIDD